MGGGRERWGGVGGEGRELVLMVDLTEDPQQPLWVDIVSLT